LSVLPKPRQPNGQYIATSRGDDGTHDVETTIYHLDDAGNYLKYAFFNFIKILLNCVPNYFLQQGYTPYGAPSLPFPRRTTPGDPSTPHIDSA
jgi:hypothetical protein